MAQAVQRGLGCAFPLGSRTGERRHALVHGVFGRARSRAARFRALRRSDLAHRGARFARPRADGGTCRGGGRAVMSPIATATPIRPRAARKSAARAKRPHTAFVLSGGASLGALQVGMLRALYERGIAADLLVGTSV